MYQNYFIASTAPCYLFPTCTIVSMYLLSLIFQTWFLNYIILTYIYLQYCHKLYFFTMLIKKLNLHFLAKYVTTMSNSILLTMNYQLKSNWSLYQHTFLFLFVISSVQPVKFLFVTQIDCANMICIGDSFCTRNKLYLLNI